ncbi:MAG: alpha/beta fold hydrolase [Bacteriovoracaceae bacterium]
MIALTKVPAEKSTDINLFLIPGGPGLSSRTIRCLDLLSKAFNLYYIDFPGTNLNPYYGKQSFQSISDSLAEVIQKIDGVNVVVGHSFGGLFACDLSCRIDLRRLICLATPMSNKTLESANFNYSTAALPLLKEKEELWKRNPSDETFKAWLSEYSYLYFTEEKILEGHNILKNDLSSAQFFLDNRSDLNNYFSIFNQSKNKFREKILIAGEKDRLLPVLDLEADAIANNFSFKMVDNAGHFMMIDQPAEVATIISNFILKSGEL